ncbi:MAG: ElyC/SanA/YdcF family protein [Oleibacter sp.]|nr:ElyC/SanA/YdcF family protein [Thalassolituus sp.]
MMEIGFIIKKIIGSVIMPIPITLLLILLGIIWLKSSPIKARLTLLTALLILGASSFHPIADKFIAMHEQQYPTFDIQQPVDAVVVLGSASHSAPPNSTAVMNLGNSAAFRLLEGLRILRANDDAVLIVTGYAGLGNENDIPHAELLKRSAIEQGIEPSRIYSFPTAQDTEQEARLTAPLLRYKKFALVTEASHLSRAMIFFKNEGLKPIPAPAIRTGAFEPDWRIESRATYKTERAIYETLGRTWQWLKNQFS